MSYLVLARKYRPRRFAEMVGQEHVVQALGNALAQQRLHHAYLFTGTRGVGKTTVARIFAKSVNCTGADGQGGITAEPCGVCDACQAIDAGRFVDYIELDAASNRGVDEITQLLDQAVYKPVMGRFKVYMIDEVHMLSTTAFNAMLKTLEEPPEYLKFVLATTDPQKVPATVLSRCLQFNLRPMAPETVAQHLAHVLEAESVDAEPGALRVLARAARGSMRDALSLTDQAIAYGGGALQEAAVRQMLGAVDRSHAVAVLQALAAGDGAALLGTVDALRDAGLSAAGLLEDLSLLTQQLAVLQAVPQAGDAQDPDTPQLQALARLLPADETQLLYSIALHGRAELALAPDEYSGLLMVLLRALAFRPAASGAAAAAASVSASNAPAAMPTAAAPVTATPGGATPAESGAALARAAVLPRSSLLRAPAPAVASAPLQAREAAADVRSMASRPAPRETAPVPVSAGPRAPLARESVPPWEDAVEEPPLVDPEPADGPPAIDAAPPMAPAVPVVAAASVPAPAQAAPVIAVASSPLDDRWVALVGQLIERSAVAALVRELAWQAQCADIDESVTPARWTLHVERESLRQPANVERLRAALADLLGTPLALAVEIGTVSDSAARRDAAARAQAQQRAEEIILNDDVVVGLLARFPGATVVPGSIRPVR